MIGFFFLEKSGLEPVGNHVHMIIIRCYYDILKCKKGIMKPLKLQITPLYYLFHLSLVSYVYL